ncbi:MAG: class I SAM-dependent methyltransferase [Isosphaeraceae bacterium]|nr:class I SAM-dependent methyltransferase [Isosphaeraceae bacterium]
MSTIHADTERFVAERFDAAHARFKASLAPSDHRLRAILDALGSVEGCRILDIGCGKGRFARALEDRGALPVGIDVSHAMLAEALSIDRVRASAGRLPFGDASFDAVIAVESFQHLPDVDGAIQEAARVLRPGGRLVIIDKNRGALNSQRCWLPNTLIKWIDEFRGLALYRPGEVGRERWFAPRRLRRSLERAGLREISDAGLLGPREAGRAIFKNHPRFREMWIWQGRRPGGER